MLLSFDGVADPHYGFAHSTASTQNGHASEWASNLARVAMCAKNLTLVEQGSSIHERHTGNGLIPTMGNNQEQLRHNHHHPAGGNEDAIKPVGCLV